MTGKQIYPTGSDCSCSRGSTSLRLYPLFFGGSASSGPHLGRSLFIVQSVLRLVDLRALREDRVTGKSRDHVTA